MVDNWCMQHHWTEGQTGGQVRNVLSATFFLQRHVRNIRSVTFIQQEDSAFFCRIALIL
jgi:hypothetical protein